MLTDLQSLLDCQKNFYISLSADHKHTKKGPFEPVDRKREGRRREKGNSRDEGRVAGSLHFVEFVHLHF